MTAAVRGLCAAPRPVGAALAAGISLAVSAIFWAAVAAIRVGLPPPGGFGLADLRCWRVTAS